MDQTGAAQRLATTSSSEAIRVYNMVFPIFMHRGKRFSPKKELGLLTNKPGITSAGLRYPQARFM
ncbi:hypothetical protein D3C78_1775980 [compost metagenome]